MHITLDTADGRLRIGPARDAAAAPSRQAFYSEWTARSFVLRYFRDAFQMSRLRAAFATEVHDVARWTDDEVLSATVYKLVSGAWRVWDEQARPTLAPAAAGVQAGPAGLGMALRGGQPPASSAPAGRSRLPAPSPRTPAQTPASVSRPAVSEWSDEAADQVAQAETLERAAARGAPFCEICEAMRKARQASEHA